MSTEFTKMELSTITDGQIQKEFVAAIESVLADFESRNKKTETKRRVTLSFDFAMDEDSRIEIMSSCDTKLAANGKRRSFAILSDKGEMMQKVEVESVAPDNVTQFDKTGEG